MYWKLPPLRDTGHSPSVAAFACFAILLGPAAVVAGLPQKPSDADIIFHITDFGINQWKASYVSGQNFGNTSFDKDTANRVHTKLCANNGGCNAQILLVMPELKREGKIDHAELKAELKAILQKKIDAAIANHQEFEIQLVQYIDTDGNFDELRQAQVRDFGRAAYEAIGEVRRNLVEQKGFSVYTDATAGSNGTVALTKNVSSWSDYIQAIDLVDGRAGMYEAIDAIDAVIKLTGRNNVRLFATNGDHLAANRPMAYALYLPSKVLGVITNFFANAPGLGGLKGRFGTMPKMAIANPHIIAEIVRLRPRTEAFLTTRLDLRGESIFRQITVNGKQLPGTAHVSSIDGRAMNKSQFKVQFIIPKKRPWGFDTSVGITVDYDDLRSRAGLETSYIYDELLQATGGTPATLVATSIPTTSPGNAPMTTTPGAKSLSPALAGPVLWDSQFKASRVIPAGKWGFDIAPDITLKYDKRRYRDPLKPPYPFDFSTPRLDDRPSTQTPMTMPTDNRGGVLMGTESEIEVRDLQSLRRRILEGSK